MNPTLFLLMQQSAKKSSGLAIEGVASGLPLDYLPVYLCIGLLGILIITPFMVTNWCKIKEWIMRLFVLERFREWNKKPATVRSWGCWLFRYKYIKKPYVPYVYQCSLTISFFGCDFFVLKWKETVNQDKEGQCMKRG